MSNNPSVVWRPFWSQCLGRPKTSPRWPTAVAANGLNQLYRRLSDRASNYSTLQTGTTTKLPYESQSDSVFEASDKYLDNTVVLNKPGDIDWGMRARDSGFACSNQPFTIQSDKHKRHLQCVLDTRRVKKERYCTALLGIRRCDKQLATPWLG